MPWKSKAQMRKFYAMANRGEISREEVQKWKEHTPDIKSLPERSPKKKFSRKHFEKSASGNLPMDAAEMARFDDQSIQSSGASLRADAETGQARGRATRTKGVLNEDREFGSQYKVKYQTSRGGKHYGSTIREKL